MDEYEFLPGLFLGLVLALVSSGLSYSCAESTIRDQAIAAKVGCWVIDKEGGQRRFIWDCPKDK